MTKDEVKHLTFDTSKEIVLGACLFEACTYINACVKNQEDVPEDFYKDCLNDRCDMCWFDYLFYLKTKQMYGGENNDKDSSD